MINKPENWEELSLVEKWEWLNRERREIERRVEMHLL